MQERSSEDKFMQLGIWENLDEAIIGVVERCNQEPIVCYDYEKVVKIISKDMGVEAAIEFIDFNVLGAWVGDKTPFMLFRTIEGMSVKEWIADIRKNGKEVGGESSS